MAEEHHQLRSSDTRKKRRALEVQDNGASIGRDSE
jgi:hypothetical protein